jgi:hypothetical protein
MNTCYSGRSSRPARLFSFGLLDGPQVRLCRPHLREASAGLRSQPLRALNNPGLISEFQLTERDLADPEAFVAALKHSIEHVEEEDP